MGGHNPQMQHSSPVLHRYRYSAFSHQQSLEFVPQWLVVEELSRTMAIKVVGMGAVLCKV